MSGLICCLFWLLASAFDVGMGEDAWAHLKTPEDQRRFHFFKEHYENQCVLSEKKDSIPKTLHVVWLGPKPFPEESVSNLKGWMRHHPGWTVKFWTDQKRAFSIPGLEVELFSEYPFAKGKALYYESDNFGEKSMLLRYAILEEEGGVYIDHDVACLKSLEPLSSRLDFFCALEELGPTVLSSNVYPSMHLIAARAHHPVLEAAFAWLENHWECLGIQYPGRESAAIMYRTKRRTLSALDAGIQAALDAPGMHNVVFPASAFSSATPTKESFATHAHLGSWHRPAQEWETACRRRLDDLMSTQRLLVFLSWGGIALSAAVLLLFFKARQR